MDLSIAVARHGGSPMEVVDVGRVCQATSCETWAAGSILAASNWPPGVRGGVAGGLDVG